MRNPVRYEKQVRRHCFGQCNLPCLLLSPPNALDYPAAWLEALLPEATADCRAMSAVSIVFSNALTGVTYAQISRVLPCVLRAATILEETSWDPSLYVVIDDPVSRTPRMDNDIEHIIFSPFGIGCPVNDYFVSPAMSDGNTVIIPLLARPVHECIRCGRNHALPVPAVLKHCLYCVPTFVGCCEECDRPGRLHPCLNTMASLCQTCLTSNRFCEASCKKCGADCTTLFPVALLCKKCFRAKTAPHDEDRR